MSENFNENLPCFEYFGEPSIGESRSQVLGLRLVCSTVRSRPPSPSSLPEIPTMFRLPIIRVVTVGYSTALGSAK